MKMKCHEGRGEGVEGVKRVIDAESQLSVINSLGN
jgi:hypothetical protein